MRFLLPFLYVLTTSVKICGQDSSIQRSRFELFSAAPERVFQTSHKRIGNVSQVIADLYKAVELKSGDTARAFVFGYNIITDVKLTDNIILDEKDIPNVIAFLNSMKELSRQENPPFEPSYTYITSGDIILTCEYSRNFFRKGWWLKIGRIYKYLRVPVGYSVVFKNIEFSNFSDLLQKSLTMNFNK